MKKLATAAALAALLCAACATGGPAAAPEEAIPEDAVSLDEAIQIAADAIAQKMAPGIGVLVVDFKSPSPQLSDYLTEKLMAAMGQNNAFRLIDRKNLAYALAEQNYNADPNFSDKPEDYASLGRQLGAKSVVVGALADLGNAYLLNVATVQTETTEREATTLKTVRKDRGFQQLVAGLQRAAPRPSPAAGTQQDAVSHYTKGEASYDRDDYDMAIAEFTEAIRIDPNYANAYYNRSSAYYLKKDYDRAIADYTQAIRIDPNHAIAYVGRGVAYWHKGDYDRAIADYTQAIRLDPNYAAAYRNRGNAYTNKGDYDRAIADYTQALRISPDNEEAKAGLEAARQARGR